MYLLFLRMCVSDPCLWFFSLVFFILVGNCDLKHYQLLGIFFMIEHMICFHKHYIGYLEVYVYFWFVERKNFHGCVYKIKCDTFVI